MPHQPLVVIKREWTVSHIEEVDLNTDSLVSLAVLAGTVNFTVDVNSACWRHLQQAGINRKTRYRTLEVYLRGPTRFILWNPPK